MLLPNPLRVIRTFVVACSAVLLSAATCFACDCIDLTPPDSLKAADLVFVGSAVTVNSAGNEGNTTFRVQQVLKGTPTAQTVITSEMTDCDRSFQQGNTYVVYARQWDGKLFAPTCLSTQLLRGPQEPIIRYTSQPRYGYRAAVAGVILLLALAVGYIVGRGLIRA